MAMRGLCHAHHAAGRSLCARALYRRAHFSASPRPCTRLVPSICHPHPTCHRFSRPLADQPPVRMHSPVGEWTAIHPWQRSGSRALSSSSERPPTRGVAGDGSVARRGDGSSRGGSGDRIVGDVADTLAAPHSAGKWDGQYFMDPLQLIDIDEAAVDERPAAARQLVSNPFRDSSLWKGKESVMADLLYRFFGDASVLRACEQSGLSTGTELYGRAQMAFRNMIRNDESIERPLVVAVCEAIGCTLDGDLDGGRLHDAPRLVFSYSPVHDDRSRDSAVGSAGGATAATAATILPHFLAWAHANIPEVAEHQMLRRYSDLRQPWKWYPLARQRQRKIVFHAGPTNSGKTHHALERFRAAASGVYCGPLRLLALEIFDSTNAQGVRCDLVTGEERRTAGEDGQASKHVSCTVEMAAVGESYECAVIDEIQMLADESRGWAWTRALLGLDAAEIHVCGEERAVRIVSDMCRTIGEQVEVRRYNRLTPLVVDSSTLLGRYEHVERGDCVVAFSRKAIFEARLRIERATNLKCAVIYGSLPPAARSHQARLFNEADSGYDVLVASDAIGMGLNLHIGRIIFSTISKYDGEKVTPLEHSQIKQIAGRAGRFQSRFPRGRVTTYTHDDLKPIEEALASELQHIEMAGLLPTFDQIELYAAQAPGLPLSSLLGKFRETAHVDGHFFVCDLGAQMTVADLIQPLDMPLKHRYAFCIAPVKTDDAFVMSTMLQYARAFSLRRRVRLRRLASFDSMQAPSTDEELQRLESIHRCIDLYLWLGQRYQDTFPDGEYGLQLQQRCSDLITIGLARKSERRVDRDDRRSRSSPGARGGLIQRHAREKNFNRQRYGREHNHIDADEDGEDGEDGEDDGRVETRKGRPGRPGRRPPAAQHPRWLDELLSSPSSGGRAR